MKAALVSYDRLAIEGAAVFEEIINWRRYVVGNRGVLKRFSLELNVSIFVAAVDKLVRVCVSKGFDTS